jgi:hypothetical protein
MLDSRSVFGSFRKEEESADHSADARPGDEIENVREPSVGSLAVLNDSLDLGQHNRWDEPTNPAAIDGQHSHLLRFSSRLERHSVFHAHSVPSAHVSVHRIESGSIGVAEVSLGSTGWAPSPPNHVGDRRSK